MILFTRRTFRWLVGAGFFFALIVATSSGWRWLTRDEGNAEEVFSRLRLGMGQQEAVELLLTFDASSCQYSRGITTDGREFSTISLPTVADLPRPSEIEYCILEAEDYNGREIEVTLGRGGIVSSKRLSPSIWKVRWHKAYCALRDKPYGKLLDKYRCIALSSVAVFLLLSAWMVRRRVVKVIA